MYFLKGVLLSVLWALNFLAFTAAMAFLLLLSPAFILHRQIEKTEWYKKFLVVLNEKEQDFLKPKA